MSTDAESQAVQEFRSAALAYCRLLEDVDTIELSTFVRSCHESLAKLYLAGLSLPLVEPGTEEATQRMEDHARWKVARNALARKLGDQNLYWLVFDPCDPDEHRAIQHTLSDDLAGVYEDVKGGLE